MLRRRTIYVPPLEYGSARALAAAFRAAGLDAEALPPSDERTREISRKYTSGDECHPFQILVGDVMKHIESGRADPAASAFLLPMLDGPCRASRFVPDLREILQRSGYGQAGVSTFDPSDSDGGMEELGEEEIRAAWRALVSAGILHKLRLSRRPFEATKGDIDGLYEQSIGDLCDAVESAPACPAEQLEVILSALFRIRGRFRGVSAKGKRSAPLVGIVGEVFCRFNTLLNSDLARQIEERGGKAWLAGMTVEASRYVRTSALSSVYLCDDLAALSGPFREDFADLDEPGIDRIMEYARPYLPSGGRFAGVALRLGQIVHMAKRGADCIIDASPFPCINASACASFYPRLSRDLDGLPIQVFYFGGAYRDWSDRIDDYLDLSRAYRKRKKEERT